MGCIHNSEVQHRLLDLYCYAMKRELFKSSKEEPRQETESWANTWHPPAIVKLA